MSIVRGVLISNSALGAWPASLPAKYEGTTTYTKTSCFHQFLSRCCTRSLETRTHNSIAKTYCSIASPTSQFQINQSIPMRLVLLKKLNNGNIYIYINDSATCKALLSLTNCLLNVKTSKAKCNSNINV